MPDGDLKSWRSLEARTATRVRDLGVFIRQQVYPILVQRTFGQLKRTRPIEIRSEEHFWGREDELDAQRKSRNNLNEILFNEVKLIDFRLTDWFPRAPGLYWNSLGSSIRAEATNSHLIDDQELGAYFAPRVKGGLVDKGGIGTIRLLPRKIDDKRYWFSTALKGNECHAGIPLAIPDDLLRNADIQWGDRVNLNGRVRFLQETQLYPDSRIYKTRPLMIFVEKITGIGRPKTGVPILISPVCVFRSKDSDHNNEYTFSSCAAGSDSQLDRALEWMQKYAAKFNGELATNFDEQRPALADAPLSYQRLVQNSYDRKMLQSLGGSIFIERLEQVFNASQSVQQGDIYMGHKIDVSGIANINIDSSLRNVSQTVKSSSGLNSSQKTELDDLVRALSAELDRLRSTHPAESAEIATALKKVVDHAAKPKAERKPSLLKLSAKGLKEAAKLVKNIAPAVLQTAGLIAKFVVGLS